MPAAAAPGARRAGRCGGDSLSPASHSATARRHPDSPDTDTNTTTDTTTTMTTAAAALDALLPDDDAVSRGLSRAARALAMEADRLALTKVVHVVLITLLGLRLCTLLGHSDAPNVRRPQSTVAAPVS